MFVQHKQPAPPGQSVPLSVLPAKARHKPKTAWNHDVKQRKGWGVATADPVRVFWSDVTTTTNQDLGDGRRDPLSLSQSILFSTPSYSTSTCRHPCACRPLTLPLCQPPANNFLSLHNPPNPCTRVQVATVPNTTWWGVTGCFTRPAGAPRDTMPAARFSLPTYDVDKTNLDSGEVPTHLVMSPREARGLLTARPPPSYRSIRVGPRRPL